MLDVAETLRWVRAQTIGETGREVQWEIGPQTTFQGDPDPEKTTLHKILYHVNLPTKSADGKAEKIVHKLHLIIRNEW